MDFSIAPASNYPVSDLVRLLNRGFEEYFVPIHFNSATFSSMLSRDDIDLTDSRVLLVNHEPRGIALIACRTSLHASRLAAMGIAKETRGKGAGSWFMDKLIAEARQRSDQEMVLEVIEQNEPAVKLYRNSGFQTVRRLIGFVCESAEESQRSNLYEMELREMAGLITQHGLSDLPWQLSGESIAQMTTAVYAYRKGQTYIVVSNPDVEHIVIWSLLVERNARGNGLGTDMLKTIIANYAARTWHVPALLPEEFGKVFERAGFKQEKLSQWQMKLTL